MALRDAGVTSGMKLVRLQVVGPDGNIEDIPPRDDGVRYNWRRPRRLLFEESTLHKGRHGLAWPALTAVFGVALRALDGEVTAADVMDGGPREHPYDRRRPRPSCAHRPPNTLEHTWML